MTDILVLLDRAIDDLRPAETSRTSRKRADAGSVMGTLNRLNTHALPVLPAPKQEICGSNTKTEEKTDHQNQQNEISPDEYILKSSGSSGSTGSREDFCGFSTSRGKHSHGKYGRKSSASHRIEASEEQAAIVDGGDSARYRGDTEEKHAVDPGWWSAEYVERAAIRQYDGGYPRAEAESLAWRELENRWNLAHGERVSRELCAGCRRTIGTEAALDLIDGNRVHDRDGNECLIRHGERWRTTAAKALSAMGLQPPAGLNEP
ncbi:MAG: hypothetical protein WA459_04685 [Stellaceae bacterium]